MHHGHGAAEDSRRRARGVVELVLIIVDDDDLSVLARCRDDGGLPRDDAAINIGSGALRAPGPRRRVAEAAGATATALDAGGGAAAAALVVSVVLRTRPGPGGRVGGHGVFLALVTIDAPVCARQHPPLRRGRAVRDATVGAV